MSKVLPNGWTQSSISQITSSNSIFADGDWVESKDQDPEGANRLIQLADIGDGKFINKSNRYLNDEQFSRLRCTELLPNDVLVARMPDPLGRACIFPKLNQKAATVVDVAVIRTPNVDPYWLMSAINSADFRTQIELSASGTTRTRIARGALAEIPLQVPPLNEQQKIASILTAVDEVIASTTAQINKLKDLKTGMMQELLTKGIGHTEFKDSPVGRIPKAWEIVELEKLCSWMGVGIATSTTQAYTSQDKGVPILRNQNILAGTIDSSDLLYISSEFSEQNNSKKIRARDVITIRTGYPGKSAVVTPEFDGGHTFTTLISRPDQRWLDSDYLALLVNSDYGMNFVAGGQAGGAQQNLNVSVLKMFPVKLPPVVEQRQLYELINSFAQKISISELKQRQYEKIKSALMQDLLTGVVRVTCNNTKLST